ncbi:MAG: hypothetical protein KatS3mg085_431 [Candidatus Dojkabacteria bacterium]|nr:MAG: hypothetical protein KatS3mg085_431 [Candidatus Dojkabacteria bacterium]
MEESKTTSNQDMKTEKVKSNGKSKVWLIAGLLFVIFLCCCLCVGVLGYMLFQSEDFKEGYCESLEEDDALDNDLLGLCDDWEPSYEKEDTKVSSNDSDKKADVVDNNTDTKKDESNDKKQNNDSAYVIYDGYYFSFEYPRYWKQSTSSTDWSTVEFTSEEGVVISLKSIYDNEYSKNLSGCSEYEESIFSGLTSVYDNVESESVLFTTTENGYAACYLKGYLVDGPITTVLEQYLVFDPLIDTFALEFGIKYDSRDSGMGSYLQHAVDTLTFE